MQVYRAWDRIYADPESGCFCGMDGSKSASYGVDRGSWLLRDSAVLQYSSVKKLSSRSSLVLAIHPLSNLAPVEKKKNPGRQKIVRSCGFDPNLTHHEIKVPLLFHQPLFQTTLPIPQSPTTTSCTAQLAAYYISRTLPIPTLTTTRPHHLCPAPRPAGSGLGSGSSRATRERAGCLAIRLGAPAPPHSTQLTSPFITFRQSDDLVREYSVD